MDHTPSDAITELMPTFLVEEYEATSAFKHLCVSTAHLTLDKSSVTVFTQLIIKQSEEHKYRNVGIDPKRRMELTH